MDKSIHSSLFEISHELEEVIDELLSVQKSDDVVELQSYIIGAVRSLKSIKDKLI